MTEEKKWLLKRLGSLAFAFAAGPFVIALQILQVGMGWFDCAFVFVGMVFFGVFFGLMCVFNPRIEFSKISWYTNPYDVRKTHVAMHFFAIHSMAFGAGGSMLLIAHGTSSAPSFCFFLLVGAGLWTGLGLVVLLFRKRPSQRESGDT
jgi:hypothetical protein